MASLQTQSTSSSIEVKRKSCFRSVLLEQVWGDGW